MNDYSLNNGIMRRLPALILAAVLLFSALPANLFNKVLATQAEGDVLYEENFDSTAEGSLPSGWTLSEALSKSGAAVKDKALRIDSLNTEFGKVLLPDSLSQYGNYSIEADITFESSRDDARWFSIVFRQQNTDEDYYQMCVRKNASASNGIEFAIRSPGKWNVVKTGSADTAETAHIKVSVYDGLVYEYYNDKLIISSNALESQTNYFKTGEIGFQANFSIVNVDNVKVTALKSDPEAGTKIDNANKHYVAQKTVYSPIISPASVVTAVNDTDSLEKALSADRMPQTLILYVNEELNVTNKAGDKTIGTLPDIIEKIDMKIVPAFYVKNKAASDALKDYLNKNDIVDAFIMSDNKELVKDVRSKLRKLRGIIDFTSMDFSAMTDENIRETLNSLIYDVNENSARVALIPESIAAKANVEYMQHRLITVWVEESVDSDILLHNAIQSGANGIVTDTPDALFAAYSYYVSEYNDYTVLVRNPLIVGHRGLPSAAPENSLESAKEAVNAGTDCIELDIRLTSDGVVMIYHDDDLSTMTTGSGTVNSHTYDEIRSYDLIKSSSYGSFAKYPKVKVATLEEFFAEFQDSDVMFFIEVKEVSAKLAEETARLVEKYNMKDRIAIITFITSEIPAYQRVLPGVSMGCLCGVPGGLVTEDVIEAIMNNIGPLNSTFNPSIINDAGVIRGLMNRGITCWPWTYGQGNTADAYLLGAGGITTDFANVAGHIPTEIQLNAKMEYTLNPEINGAESLTFSPTVLSRLGVYDYNGKYSDGKSIEPPELVILDGGEFIEVNGNTITAKKDGTAHLMYRFVTSTVPENSPQINTEFTLYTQVITINVDSEAERDPDLPKGTAGANNNASGLSKGAIIAIAASCAVVLAVIAVVIIIHVRKGKKA